MKKMQLDKFLQDETTFEVELKGKTYTADVSSMTLLDVFSKFQDPKIANDVKKSTQILFDAVFGKEAAAILLNGLGVEGITQVSEEIGKYMQSDTGK